MSATIKSFLEREKHDLRDKSNKDDERKKAREREREQLICISFSKGHTDIFEEGIESLHCAGILYNCLQNLEKKLSKISEISSSTKEAKIKGAGPMEEVDKAIKFINKKLEEMQEDRKQKKDKFRN